VGEAAAREPRLGVDIGRVIIAGPEHRSDPGDPDAMEREDTAFFGADDAAALRTPRVDGAFVALAGLVEVFEGRVWLVSKASERSRRRSMAWLDHHGFWSATGVDRGAVRFCFERHEKAPIARDLGLTHMVDDRIDVHVALRGIVPHRFLFGGTPEQDRLGRLLDEDVVPAPTWGDADHAIRATLTP